MFFESRRSPFKDRLPTKAQVAALIRADRAVRARWKDHPEEIPEAMQKRIRAARFLNQKAIRLARAHMSKFSSTKVLTR